MRTRQLIILYTAGTVIAFSWPLLAEEPQLRVPRTASPYGIRRFRPQTWGIVGTELTNPLNRDAEILISTYFDQDPGLQYGRMFWVPAGARRKSWYSIYVPKINSLQTTQLEIKTVVLDRSFRKERLLKESSGEMIHRDILLLRHGRSQTVMIEDPADGKTAARDSDTAIDAILATRWHRNLPRTFAVIRSRFLPPTEEALDGVDQLVLTNDRFAGDAAGLIAVRNWLQAGGRLWIMLDRVSPSTVEKLLGDAVPFQTVNRTSLTQVQIKARDKKEDEVDAEPRAFEQPVEFVRVVVTGADVSHEVNGWPAAFWQRFGRGRVLFTTLGMRAWLRQPTDLEQGQSNGTASPRFRCTPPLESLAVKFYALTEPPQSNPELFQDYLKQQIGYEIVSRRWVFLVLAMFCVSLLAAALWLARRKQLERLRWFGPALAAVAAGVLLVMGNQSKSTVLDTFAFVQLVHVEIDSENVQATGLLAEYHADASTDHLAAETGGLFHPEMAGESGSTRRLIRTDMNRWHWENLVIPSGVQLTRFQFSTRIQQRLKITSRFGPQGLTGQLDTGPFAKPSDLVIATESHFQMSVDLQPNGTFSAGSDRVLAAGEFVSGAFLNDEQLRRQQVYRKLLPRDRVTPHFDRPTLLVWTKLLPMGLRFPAGVRHIGSALLTIPLRIKSTPPGERVRIPAPFLPYMSVKDPSDGSQSPTYSNRLRRWTERSGPTKTWLRFQLPQQVLPLRLDRAVLTVQINGPAGKLEIAGWADGEMVSLGTRQNPLGRVRFVIERPEALKVDNKGGLLLAVLVGEQETAAKPVSGKTIRARWKIESIRLQVSGETAKR